MNAPRMSIITSRTEAAGKQPSFETIEVKPLVESTIAQLQPALEHNGFAAQIDCRLVDMRAARAHPDHADVARDQAHQEEDQGRRSCQRRASCCSWPRSSSPKRPKPRPTSRVPV